MVASNETAESSSERTGPLSGLGEGRPVVVVGLLAAFLVAAILVYRPAFGGPFVSDDSHWLAHNPYVQELSAENLLLIARPLGEASFAVGNFAPVPLLILGLEYRIFGQQVEGYHVVNVLLHALASALLVAVFLRSKLPPVAALLGGAFFLLHPANVEAVAWISQLKTTSSMVLGLGAVLLFSRRPALATLLFALALLAKPTAFVALPLVALLSFWGRAAAEPPRRLWLGVWLAVLVIYSIPELRLQQMMGVVSPPETDAGVRVRSIPSFAARYLVMAATSWGVSAFHQPELPRSWLDPWFLAGLGLFALLGWRTVWALRRRRVEAAWWLWAALSFAPVSQVLPFIYPMADRYLYFILPGLIGGSILAAGDLARRPMGPGRPIAALLARGAVAVALGVLGIFAVHSHQRAGIWASSTAIFLDGAKHYPNGIEGNIRRALGALRGGDRDGAIRALEAAHARGFHVLGSLVEDPALAPLRGDPRFEALIREIAIERIERSRAKPNMSLFDLPPLAKAHLVLGQFGEAIAVLDRAPGMPGSDHPALQAQIEPLRRYAEQERRRGGGQPVAPLQP